MEKSSEHTKPNPTGSAKKSHIPEKQNKIRQVLQRKVPWRILFCLFECDFSLQS
jgi:hypothetical protein